MLCKSTLKEKGFSDSLIRDLLPEPVLKPNPHYRKASMMQLWEEADVEKAMQTEQFKQYQETRARRKKAAEKAVETKTKKLIAEVEKQIPTISVKRLSIKNLRKRTLSDKRAWFEYQNDIRGNYGETVSFNDTNEDTITRWMVNYVRHNCTSYDRNLDILFGKTGKDEGYVMLRNAVLAKIAEVYPELADECMSQSYPTE